jgi:predicted secreted Zn-dependent protease
VRNNSLALAFIVACFACLLDVPFARAQSNVVRKTNYYAMTGASIRHIQQSLRQTRPWKDKSQHDASTEWRIQWHANFSPGGGECHCNNFGTTTTITITLPRWIAPTNAPASVRAAWHRYVTALAQHEAGHADIALAAAAEMHRRIPQIKSGDDCATLKSKVQSECTAILDAHRAQEKEYDQRTRHGATQGATLRGRRPGGPDAEGTNSASPNQRSQ